MVKRFIRSGAAAAAVSCAVVLLTRAPVRSQYLFSWDSVNFALALDRWDLSLHQPHPPGYLGYVWLARAFRLVAPDANTALILVGVLATIVSGVAWFRLALRHGIRPIHAWAGLLILLTSPLVWFYSSVAEVSALEMLCVLLVATACLNARQGKRSSIALAAAYAVCACVKLPTAVVMMPLALTAGPGRRVRAFSIGAGAVLATFGVMMCWDPQFPSLFWQQFVSGTEQSRLVAGHASSLLHVLNTNVRDTMQASVMAGAALVATLPYAVWRSGSSGSVDRTWALFWVLPSLATVLFVHLGKPGYLAPLVPLACLYVAAGFDSMGRRGSLLLGGVALLNLLQFLGLSSPNPESVGERLKYADKDFWQRRMTDLAPITFATSAHIGEEDRRLEAVVREVRVRCATGGVVLSSLGGEIDWRRAMFYLPEFSVVRLEGARGPLTVASHRSIQIDDERQPQISSCDPVWIASEYVTSTATIQPPDAGPERLMRGLWLIRGSATVTVESGKQVIVNRGGP
jgi:hypothetical protein